MRNLFINLTCIVLLAFSATTLTANAKIYAPQDDFTGGYVIIVTGLADGDEEVRYYDAPNSLLMATPTLSVGNNSASTITVSSASERGNSWSVLNAQQYFGGIVIPVSLSNYPSGSHTIIVNYGGQFVDSFEVIVP